MTIAPDTPTDIARRQRTLVTEAWGYTQRTRTVDDLPDPTDGWDLRAACRGTDPDLFIATRGPAGNQAALRVCAGCRVIDDCRVDAVRCDDQATVRGHMLPKERNQWLKGQGIHRPSLPSASSQRPTGKRGSRRIPLDVPRIVQLRQGGATYAEIAGVIGCTPRTAHRRYVEWERQQGGAA